MSTFNKKNHGTSRFGKGSKLQLNRHRSKVASVQRRKYKPTKSNNSNRLSTNRRQDINLSIESSSSQPIIYNIRDKPAGYWNLNSDTYELSGSSNDVIDSNLISNHNFFGRGSNYSNSGGQNGIIGTVTTHTSDPASEDELSNKFYRRRYPEYTTRIGYIPDNFDN